MRPIASEHDGGGGGGIAGLWVPEVVECGRRPCMEVGPDDRSALGLVGDQERQQRRRRHKGEGGRSMV
jgi:hypothetical protein